MAPRRTWQICLQTKDASSDVFLIWKQILKVVAMSIGILQFVWIHGAVDLGSMEMRKV